MAWGLAVATRNAALTAALALADGGSLEIRSGSRPASPADAATGTLLADVDLQSPAFLTPASGLASVSNPSSVTASGTGSATWCRVRTSGGVTVMDGSVTESGGGGDVQLESTSIVTDQNVDITGGSIVMPQGG